MNNDTFFDLIDACENISRQIVLKSHATAKQLGLSPSDFECLHLLIQSGPITATRFAHLARLTTGAMTGVIDRLEISGFATRQPDTSDRRRITIAPTTKAIRQISAINKKSQGNFHRCFANYSKDELGIILTFLQTTTDFLHQETIRIINKK